MPTFIKERKASPWKGQFRREGKTEVAYFNNEDDAKEWEEQRFKVWKRKSLGMKADIADLKHVTVATLVDTYKKKVTRKKASCETETFFLDNFVQWRDMAKRPLIMFQRADAVEFVEYLEDDYQWQGKTYIHYKTGKETTPKYTPRKNKPGTVKKKIAILKHMWGLAPNWRGFEGLKGLDDPNPWIKMPVTGTSKKRTRRLDDHPTRNNELNRLLAACDGCYGNNKIYMRLLIHMAVQLGMRLQEIMLLQLNDVDLKNNRINIYKSKTDYRSEEDGRQIVLTTAANIYLDHAIHKLGGVEKTERIIKFSKGAFALAWLDLIKRAGINTAAEDAKLRIPEGMRGLQFKDLRREAGSRFDEAGLTNQEHDLMLGHSDQAIRGVYIAPFLGRIEKKLNDYWRTATNYHDDDLASWFKDLRKGKFISEERKQRIREEDERAKTLPGLDDPEVQKKLEAYSKRVERKKQIEETPNVVKMDAVLKHRQKVGR